MSEGCFMAGTSFCRAADGEPLIQVGETVYCAGCYEAGRKRAQGDFPFIWKPMTRKLHGGGRWRGTGVAHAN